MVEQAIKPYSGSHEGRFLIRGRCVRLKPRVALALAMALQELVTNAVKYGALSNSNGKVLILWTTKREQNLTFLRLRWAEAGGPPVRAPSRRGFGSRLIERSLASDLGGNARLEFQPSGLICTIEALIPSS